MPQPLHRSASMISCRCRLMPGACTGHGPTHDWQITPFQARQVSRFSLSSPIRGADIPLPNRSTSTGQASTQAAQKVQPASGKSSQGTPARSWPAGCRRMMPGSQASTQGCAQSTHRVSSGSPVCQGGVGPSGCRRRVSRARPSRVSIEPRRNARRSGSVNTMRIPVATGLFFCRARRTISEMCCRPAARHSTGARGTVCR